jgi:hypothetical protein
MAKWKELPPSPEAIVRAALERAAEVSVEEGAERVSECKADNAYSEDAYAAGLHDEAEGLSVDIAAAIRAIASDPAEVAAIIKAAGEDRG